MEKHKLNSTMRLEKGRRKRTGRRVEEGDRDNGEGEIMEDKYITKGEKNEDKKVGEREKINE